MKQNKTKIVNRLRSLQDIQGVTVDISDEKGTIILDYPTEHSLNFKFIWSTDHFIGYFVDSDNNNSQAVISLWNPIDAIHFATAFSLLIELRAHREDH